MKTTYRIFRSLWVVGAALCLFSCNTVSSPDKTDADNEWVELTLQVDAASAAQSAPRKIISIDGASTDESALSDNDYPAGTIGRGGRIDRLVFAVYDSVGNILATLEGADENGQIVQHGTFPMEVKVRLVRGQVYQMAVWAQCSECNAYNTTDLRKLTVDYTDAQNNDESRDAFCAVEKFTVVQNGTRHIALTRPFAQVNLGITDDDWTAATAMGADLARSGFGISGLATEYDVLTGRSAADAVTDEYVWFASASVPEETLYIGTDRRAYKWLSMSYVLVPDPAESQAATGFYDNLHFVFGDEGETQYETRITKQIPVRRNWATNIIVGKGDITPVNN